jgi:hypothetical protein
VKQTLIPVFPLVLLVALLGCGKRQVASDRLTRQVQQWITNGTPLLAAQQILEQHQFNCSVLSYSNKQSMAQGGTNDLDSHWWDTSLSVNGRSVPVTNITHLKFTATNVWGILTHLNGQYSGGIRVMAVGH